jgi:hypothetical protein
MEEFNGYYQFQFIIVIYQEQLIKSMMDQHNQR